MKRLFVLGRIHITIGLLILALPLLAADPAKKVVIVNDGHYSTRVLASNPSAAAVQWSLTVAGCYSLQPQTIAPTGAARRDTKDQFCNPYVLADSSVLDVRSIIHFSDGKSESAFVVPPIGAITSDHPSVLGPAINDETTGSYLTFMASEKTAVTVTLYDGARNPIAVEATDVPKGASQFRPDTKFPVGFIKIELGLVQFGIVPSRAPLYGFLSVASPTNSNSIVYPFGE